jgi:hypothetical protein
MKLWYINIWLNPETGFTTDYRYEFTLHTRFISNYLSKQMRKKVNWFETDGTYRMISVNPTPNVLQESKIIPNEALVVYIPFDQNRYENIKNSIDCEYYLELLDAGFKKASTYKTVPLDRLLELLDDFRKNGCKNEWIHKKKRFKEHNIEVVLTCHFTTFDFKLIATINKISSREELCKGIVLQTDPDEICYDKEFKDVFIKKNELIITDGFDLPRFSFKLKDIFEKKFNCKLLERNF